MCSPLRDGPRPHQRSAHDATAMAYHVRGRRPLTLSESQELPGNLADHVAIKREYVSNPQAVEDREQQQRVFGRLTERLSLLDQQPRPFLRRFGFKRSISFYMDEGCYECDLKFDLFATQRRCLG